MVAFTISLLQMIESRVINLIRTILMIFFIMSETWMEILVLWFYPFCIKLEAWTIWDTFFPCIFKICFGTILNSWRPGIYLVAVEILGKSTSEPNVLNIVVNMLIILVDDSCYNLFSCSCWLHKNFYYPVDLIHSESIKILDLFLISFYQILER